jgi:Tfp pilus assembly protein PilN
MLPEIDFLPASYRQNQLKHRRQTWRGVVAVAFVALAGLGTFAQYRIHGRLEASRESMQSHAEQMTSQLDNADELYRRIRDLDAKANLVTRLRVRVPPTRILADVTSVLPEFVSLTEFRMNIETSSAKAEEKPKRGPAAQNAATDISPQAADLARLDEIDRRSTHVVSLRGLAPDDVAVSKYLAALERTGNYDQVQLLFTDHYTIRGQELRSFGIRLEVRKPRPGITPAVQPASESADRGKSPQPPRSVANENHSPAQKSARELRGSGRSS